MPSPSFSSSPATPRKDAADRYSPEMAAALRSGGTARAATRKSSGVRATLMPSAPTTIVMSVTTTTAIRASDAAVTVVSQLVDEVEKMPFGALGQPDVCKCDQHQHRVDGDPK